MDLNNVKTYLADNKDDKDVKSLISQLTADNQTVSSVQTFFEGNPNSFRSVKAVDSFVDQQVTDGVKTREDKLVAEHAANVATARKDERVKVQAELNPDLTPQEKQLKELQEANIERDRKDAEKDAKLLHAELKAQVVSEMTNKGLPITLAEFFVGGDEASTNQKMKVVVDSLTAWLTAAVNKKFKESGTDPPTTPELNQKSIDGLSASERINSNRQENQGVYKK